MGETEGTVILYVNPRQSGYSSLGKSDKVGGEDAIPIDVSIHRLDNIISVNDIDVIKVDVVGAELGVLRGSKEIIARNRPVINFESGHSVDDGLGYSKEAMWDFFSEIDYEIYLPNRVAHGGHGLSKEEYIGAHVYPRLTTNFFAIPVGRREDIKDRARKIMGVKTE